MKEFDELLEIMHRLRQECPWDREQNLQTLRTYLLEEAYEVLDAMNGADADAHIDELGDLLLQIIFQSEILSEQSNSKAILKVVTNLKEKLVRRHPHVFQENKLHKADEVIAQWDEIKRAEKKEKTSSLLDGIAKSLTSLQLAQKLGDRSKKVNFDWPNSEQVWDQYLKEVEELKEAKTKEEKEHELGDVMFSLVQWARHEGLDAEVVLATANKRFEKRFKKMEAFANAEKKDFKNLPLDEKEKLWVRAKKEE